MSAGSITFSHAICREVPDTAVDGLRAVDIGAPNLDLMRAHHTDYVAALRSTGAEVEVLPALPEFPDSFFVEDAALCLPQGAIAMRPGAPSRLGEAAAMAPELSRLYGEVRAIQGPGHIEGGDILVTEREIMIGRSARTDAAGVAELTDLVADWGWSVKELQTPPEILHFKTDCSLMAPETILSSERLAATGCFEGYEVILTAPGEEAAANAIRFNELVLLPVGFPRTAETLDRAGFSVREIGNSEAAKLDGGMSCLSLRFTPS